jgi:hypothetical protein
MSDDHDFDGQTRDHDNNDKDDKRRLKKHKKRIQWMIDYIEGKAGKGGKAIIKDDKETRNVIAYLEKLHDAVGEEVEILKHGGDKKKVKDRRHEDKNPKKE